MSRWPVTARSESPAAEAPELALARACDHEGFAALVRRGDDDGHYQGVFPVHDEGTAGSGNVTFSLDEPEAELAR